MDITIGVWECARVLILRRCAVLADVLPYLPYMLWKSFHSLGDKHIIVCLRWSQKYWRDICFCFHGKWTYAFWSGLIVTPTYNNTGIYLPGYPSELPGSSSAACYWPNLSSLFSNSLHPFSPLYTWKGPEICWPSAPLLGNGPAYFHTNPLLVCSKYPAPYNPVIDSPP